MFTTCDSDALDAQRAKQFFEDEAIRIDLKKLQDKDEIGRIFLSIHERLALNNIHELSQAFRNDLSNLRESVSWFRYELLRETETRVDDFTIKTARKLDETINEVLDPNKNATQKDKAVNNFRNTARNSHFSRDTKIAVAAVIGGVIGLALWVGLTIASGGLSALITFAGLGLAALVVTFGATHFAARSDAALRNSNMHEMRGKTVSDNLKTLLRHRKELSFVLQKQAPTENVEKRHFFRK